jgi:hypothetical protein
MKQHGSLQAFLFAASFISLPSAIDADCSLFLAPSSIPGAGLGVFVGNQTYEPGDIVSKGDVVIPLIDLDKHQDTYYSFLWDEYMWDADMFSGMESEAIQIHNVEAASGGIGGASNCILELVNVNENKHSIHMSNAGVTSESPGVGAFSPYYNRTFHSTTHTLIQVSSEFL